MTNEPAPVRRGRVLLVGLAAAAVDFDKWPELTRERLEAAFDEVERRLRDEGLEPRWCLLDDERSADRTLRDAVAAFEPDVISIGAGIRADPAHLLLFEKLVNLAHRTAPRARFAFNTDPLDTVAAVRRQL